jgi:hypothetical protein
VSFAGIEMFGVFGAFVSTLMFVFGQVEVVFELGVPHAKPVIVTA